MKDRGQKNVDLVEYYLLVCERKMIQDTVEKEAKPGQMPIPSIKD
jgi:hypothetical protein